MGCGVTGLDRERAVHTRKKMRFKKTRRWSREREELNVSLPLSTPQRSLIYIIKIQITRRMNGEPMVDRSVETEGSTEARTS